VPVLTAISQDKDSPPDDAAWARRTLAALTATLGTPDRKREAINTLREGADRPGTVADARSRAAALTVALRTVTGDDHRLLLPEMTSFLAAITKDLPATSGDWYQPAQLHAAAGNRDAARECLNELTRREPKNLFYLSLVTDPLVADNRLEEARPLATRLTDG